MKKIFFSLFSLLFLLLGTSISFAGEKQINLVFNDHAIYPDVSPLTISNRTLVPVRIVSEALGADVSWESTEQKIKIKKNEILLELVVDKKEVYKNGTLFKELDVPAMVKDSRTMVPIRFISETLGANVKWDENSKTIFITFDEKHNGMTPKEMLNLAKDKLSKVRKYEYESFGSIKTNLIVRDKSLKETTIKGETRGEYELTDSGKEYSLTTSASIPSSVDSPKTTVSIEMFKNKDGVYQNTDSGLYALSPDDELYKAFDDEDPLLKFENIYKYGTYYSFGNEENRYGKDCYTIITKYDPVKYKEKAMESFVQRKEGTVEKYEIDFLNKFKTDVSVKILIDKKSLYITKIMFETKLTLIQEDLNMTIESPSETNILNIIP